MNHIYKGVFNEMLLVHNNIPSIFKQLEYLNEYIEYTPLDHVKKQKVYSFSLFPEYIKPRVLHGLTCKITNQENWGYSIHLFSFNSIDEYLESQFKSKYRSIIRRYVSRLESSFNIKYHLYREDISPEKYSFIMQSLKEMIVTRFEQKNDTHKLIHQWNTIYKTTHKDIKDGKASLFVIYNGDQPIEISLNYHFKKILFSTISSYDINYSKFGLGHIEIYKQIEWCIANNYILFEMGVGGMDYKRRWSNHIYNFKHYVIYPNDNKFLSALGTIESYKIKIKEYLKSKKVNQLLPLIQQKLLQPKTGITEEVKIYPIMQIAENKASLTYFNTLDRVDQNDINNKVILKYFYDFLYSSQSHISDCFIVKESSNVFVFVSTNSFQKIDLCWFL